MGPEPLKAATRRSGPMPTLIKTLLTHTQRARIAK